MCLTTIDSVEIEEIEGEGWKVIADDCTDSKKHFNFVYFYNYILQPYNMWIEREHTQINSLVGIYPAGFHVFTAKKDAEIYKKSFPSKRLSIVKVKYKNVLAKGTQDCPLMEFGFLERICNFLLFKTIPLIPIKTLSVIVTQFLYVENSLSMTPPTRGGACHSNSKQL